MQDQDTTSLQDNKKIDLLVFFIGAFRCGIDILEIEGINLVPLITPVYSEPTYVKGLLNLRGQVVTVFDLGKRLGFEDSTITKKSRIIIIKSASEYIGLLVDAVADVFSTREQLVEIAPANTLEGREPYFSGIVKNQNNLTAILDVRAIIKADD